jgi:multiple sugar transport system ATP-binding protein
MALGGRIAVLHEGRVRQVGTPLDVFQHPRNRFVAQFLGSPPMNFLEGEILAAECTLWFTAGPLRLALPPGAAAFLAGRQTSRVVLGIRPEAISPRPIVGQANNTLFGTVHLVEPLGDRTDLHILADPYVHLVARVDSRDAPPRDAVVQLHFDLQRIHFFSPESGENLTANDVEASSVDR